MRIGRKLIKRTLYPVTFREFYKSTILALISIKVQRKRCNKFPTNFDSVTQREDAVVNKRIKKINTTDIHRINKYFISTFESYNTGSAKFMATHILTWLKIENLLQQLIAK